MAARNDEAEAGKRNFVAVEQHGGKVGFEVIELRGKPVIDVRRNKHVLASEDAVNRLLRIEMDLNKDVSTAAAAGHLQIVARKA